MIRDGPRICLCLCQSLDGLVHISAHGDLSNIYIAIAHSDCRQILLLHFLTACRELRNRAGRSRLGGLSAGVGVNLGVVNHDIDVLAAGQYMVNAAEADIISPSVAAEYPLGLLARKSLFFTISLQIGQSIPSRAATSLSVAVPLSAPIPKVSSHSLQAAFTSSEALSEA